jgi:hypothetical protein
VDKTEPLPFPNQDIDLLHQDMREGVFLPLELAAPGLDPVLADLVNRAIAGIKGVAAGKQAGPRPSLAELTQSLDRPDADAPPSIAQSKAADAPSDAAAEAAGAARSGVADVAAAAAQSGVANFFRVLTAPEQEKIREERERFEKKRKLAVKTRRFVIRNTAIIAGIGVAVVVAILMINSFIAAQRDRPTTAGMDSRQVVEAYYNAFGELDHPRMDSCVIKKAGKDDIDMVTRFFVTSRVRQAYEQGSGGTMPAQNWFATGAPPTAAPIFGVTDLRITQIAGDESNGELNYRAEYTLWIPGAIGGNQDGPPAITAVPGPGPEVEDFTPPLGYSFVDELTLIRYKENWRIAKLDRQY